MIYVLACMQVIVNVAAVVYYTNYEMSLFHFTAILSGVECLK